jgi:hypothetical protein
VDAQRWSRVSEIFDSAVEAPPGAQMALLDCLCDGDETLRDEVCKLLRVDGQQVAFEQNLDVTRATLAVAWVDALESAGDVACGRRIGPWRVVRELGRGGMGIVLLVERADGQFEQRAALKLVKRGSDSDALIGEAPNAINQAHRADAVREFVLTILDQARPDASQGKPIVMHRLLDQAAARPSESTDVPNAVSADILDILGKFYFDIQDYERSERLRTKFRPTNRLCAKPFLSRGPGDCGQPEPVLATLHARSNRSIAR